MKKSIVILACWPVFWFLLTSCLKKRKEIGSFGPITYSQFKAGESANLPPRPEPGIDSTQVGQDRIHILNIKNHQSNAVHKLTLCGEGGETGQKSCFRKETRSGSILLTELPPPPQSLHVLTCLGEICGSPALVQLNLEPVKDENLLNFLNERVKNEEDIRNVAERVYRTLLDYKAGPSDARETLSQIANLKEMGPGPLGDLYNSGEYFAASSALRKQNQEKDAQSTEDISEGSESPSPETEKKTDSSSSSDEERIKDMRQLFTAGQVALALGSPVFAAGVILLIGSRFAEKKVSGILEGTDAILRASSGDLDKTLETFASTLKIRSEEIKGSVKQSLQNTLDSLLIKPEHLEKLSETQKRGLYRQVLEGYMEKMTPEDLGKFMKGKLNLEIDISDQGNKFLAGRISGFSEEQSYDFLRKYLLIDRVEFEKIRKTTPQKSVQEITGDLFNQRWPQWNPGVRQKVLKNELILTTSGRINKTRLEDLDLFHAHLFETVELERMSPEAMKLRIQSYDPGVDLSGWDKTRLGQRLIEIRNRPDILLDDAISGWYSRNVNGVVNTMLVHGGEDIRVPMYNLGFGMGQVHITVDDQIRGKVDEILIGGEKGFREAVKDNLTKGGSLAEAALSQINRNIDEATGSMMDVVSKTLNSPEQGQEGLRKIIQNKTELYSKLLVSPGDVKVDGKQVKSFKTLTGDSATGMKKYGGIAAAGGFIVMAAGIAFTVAANMQLAENSEQGNLLASLGQLHLEYEDLFRKKIAGQQALSEYLLERP